ncbi:MAG: extracellular solute-binding protein [Spirochaetota bacterium]|nr:MAG: extracellular solute-binding protein [Spirochaetota bacterium]
MIRKIMIMLLMGTLLLGSGAITALASEKEEAGAERERGTVVIGVEAGTIHELFQKFEPEIERDLGVEIEFKTWPLYQSYETLMLMLTSGEAAIDLTTFLPRWMGDCGIYFTDLSKLGDFKKDFQVDQIVSGFREPYMLYKGKWIGVPFDGDTLVLIYRRDYMEDPKEKAAFKAKYGYELAPPKTGDQYNDIAEFFTRPDEDFYGHSQIFARTWENTTFFFQRLFEREGQLWDRNGNALIGNRIGQEAMLDYLKGRAWAPPGYNEVGWEQQRRLFFQGKAFMFAGWTDGPKGAADPEQAIDEVRENFSVAVLPGKWTYMFGGRNLGIPENTPNDKRDAYEVLKWLYRPELTAEMAADPSTHLDPWMYHHFDNPPLYTQMAEVGSAEAFCDAAMQSIEQGIIHIYIRFFRRYEDALATRLAQAASGEMDGVAAIKAAQDDWDRITSEIGEDIMVPEMNEYLDLLESIGYPVP